MNAKKRLEIFKQFKKNNPKPTTELAYENTFQLLIAVMLSAQATDISVNKATKDLFKWAKKPQDIIELGLEGLIEHIRTIGLFNTKAKNVMKTCQILVDQHKGKVPNDRKNLEALPGVGRKTANVILNTAFGQPTIAVDTHIFRVANRTGLAPGKTPLAVEKKLEEVIPKDYLLDAHHWLILHGRYICLARKPKCSKCPIFDWCEYEEKHQFKQGSLQT